eukprot:CAMPEP_0178636178 /NCGR_PEP_ID=MMETSP0698-20121128/13591_1 /TAXON_ID=265572 /ORGANISM="Extubocellulus spinifer, Strain CCMP396" /LENGTH=65 /DNA_ID=CAMNT_0020276027 /DNA_START=665 /DNA_END=862 /DNA_ORIENTATION=+
MTVQTGAWLTSGMPDEAVTAAVPAAERDSSEDSHRCESSDNNDELHRATNITAEVRTVDATPDHP